MSDFYTVLKQSIVDRNLRSAEAREEVYAQARTAMIRQLWSYDPPLAADEIDGRIGQFDTAVERIERDFITAFAGGPPRAGKPPRAAPARPQPVAVIEGYDEEADYAPAFGGRPEPSPPEEEEDRTRYELAPPAFRQLPHDRETAIEAALRDEPRGGEDPAEPPEAEAAYARYDAADDGDADERAEDRPPYARARQTYDDDRGGRHESREEEDDGAPDDEPARRSPGRRVAQGTRAFGSGDGNRVRILVGAIGALAVVLFAIGAYVLIPSGTAGDSAPSRGDMSIERLISDAASAERIATEPANIDQSFTLFDGQDPTVFDAVPDNPVRFEKGEETGLARISSSTSAAGARVIVGPGLANRLAGRNIRVTLVARAATIDGAGGMRFAYQSGLAISHWQRADLKPDYTAYALTWRVPSLRTDPTGDYLIIEPGIPGDGTSVEIESIKIDLLAAS